MRLSFYSLTLAITLTACSAPETQETGQSLRPVRSIVLTSGDTVRERTFSGLIQSSQASRLSFKVSGTVVSVPVQTGSRLKSGDTIATLDASSFELELEQARAKLVQAQVSQRNAQSNYDRVKGLYENSNASKNDLDIARANSETARAEVRSARKSVEIATLNKSYTVLRASTNCVIAALSVEKNENVSTGQEIATVNCGEGLEVQFGVPEGLIGTLQQGIQGTIKPNTISGISYQGTITEIGVGATSSAATYPVTATIDDPDDRIRPNMAAQVSFSISESGSNHFHLPTNAVSKDSEGTFVFLAISTDEGKATIERRSVEVGELTRRGLEIRSGLDTDDRVVTAGISFLRSGQTVLLQKGA